MRSWRSLFSRGEDAAPAVHKIGELRDSYTQLDDAALGRTIRSATSLACVVAATAVTASRVMGFELHDEQLMASLALADGHVVEMQTGEGKTLAAVPAVVWHARHRTGVHVLTANDYLARRDAEWMCEIYQRCGLTVGWINQGLSTSARKAAYRADVTYSTANEVGFDYLRDGLAFDPADVVHRPFSGVTAVIDEADSILIDEARIPLVIAGGASKGTFLPVLADRAVRELLPGLHFSVETSAQNVLLTPAGVKHIEHALGIENLFDATHLDAHTAVQDALHAHALLRKDVDYVVSDGAVLSVDEFKGRIVAERRWPAGLQTALECKEQVPRRTQGRVLGSITVEHLVGMYGGVCGMTGTAATQAGEFLQIYGLRVLPIAPHRPVARVDAPDAWFETKADKEAAVADEVRRIRGEGRPVLVGTASVEESERLSRRLASVPHHVLNARHEAEEAAIIARAGERGTVTISTNMAGRGVDIRLGEDVAALGGLHVIGTNRHDSRRIDHQLRGRAGRQGDPGSSKFFVSREDPIFVTHAAGDAGIDADQVQRIAEGQNLDVRLFLRKYESVIEGQRLTMRDLRDSILLGDQRDLDLPVRRPEAPAMRAATLETIDDLWADYLAAIAELRAGTPWLSLGGKDPHRTFLLEVDAMFRQMTTSIDVEVETKLAESSDAATVVRDRGATWTYLTSDEPFGPMTQRIMRTLVRMYRESRARQQPRAVSKEH